MLCFVSLGVGCGGGGGLTGEVGAGVRGPGDLGFGFGETALQVGDFAFYVISILVSLVGDVGIHRVDALQSIDGSMGRWRYDPH